MNVELATEVLDFAERGQFFKLLSTEISRFPYRVESFDDALAIARLPDEDVLEPNYRSLGAVFTQNETRIRDHIYACSDWREISHWETNAFCRIERAVDRVPEQYRQTIDDVLAHLAMCCLSRLAIGRDPFFERIFEAYKVGLWPCGWMETESEGDIIVFVPLAESVARLRSP